MTDIFRRLSAAESIPGRHPAAAAMLTALLLLSLAQALLPAAPVWITDNGNKYIIMRNFAQYGQLTVRHDIPGNYPAGGFHFRATPAGYRSFYPEFFPVVSALPWRLFGDFGATLLPLLAGVLLAGAAAKRFGFICGVLTLFAAPCAFYSLLLWEMIPAVLAAFIALMLMRDGKFFRGALLLGLGLFLREEMYFIGASAGLVLLFRKAWRDLGRLCAGSLLGALPVWLAQYLMTGHVLGFHGSAYYLNNRQGFSPADELAGVFWNYFQHLFRFETLPYFALFGLLAVALGFFRGGPVRKMKAPLLAAAALLFLAGAYRFTGSSALCYTAALCAGFVTTLPLGWGFWANRRQVSASLSGRTRFLAAVTVVYTFLVPPLLTRHDVGLFWGARHFLFVMPFVVFFSLRSARFMKGGKALLAGLAAVSVIWQLCGFAALSRVAWESDNFTQAVLRADPAGITASDLFFLPEQTPKLFFESTFCELVTPEQVTNLCAEMRRRKLERFTFITSPQRSRLTPQARKALAANVSHTGPVMRFESSASGFMDLLVFSIYLRKK
ncbi:MAG: hypothetical protein IJU70_07780 [Lentisphaeria bacterium]|nr:hypothetical protein [Lentisphaeria bacterium]